MNNLNNNLNNNSDNLNNLNKEYSDNLNNNSTDNENKNNIFNELNDEGNINGSHSDSLNKQDGLNKSETYNLNNTDNLSKKNLIKLSDNEILRTINWIGISLFLFLAVSQLVQYPIAALLSLINKNISSEPWYTVLITLLCIYGVAFPIFYFTIKKVPAKAPAGTKKYSIKEVLTLFAVCYAFSIVLNLFSTFVNYLISLVKGSPVINPMEALITGPQFIYVALMSCIVAPIMEEIVFRKLLLDRLNRLGSGVAIVVSAYAFAVFHGNLSQFFYAFFLGAIFAYITIKSGTVKYSMIIHLMINLMGTVISKLALDIQNAVTIVTGLMIWVIVISGFVLFFRKRKEIFTRVDDTPNSISTVKAIFSPGMLLFMAAGIAVIVLYIINC